MGTEKTVVIFRKFKDGEIVAIMPERCGSTMFFYEVESYMHDGQHSSCDISIVQSTKLATPDEYAALKAEMEGIGYNLIVKSRIKYSDCFWSQKF